jgi:hypothetical protein
MSSRRTIKEFKNPEKSTTPPREHQLSSKHDESSSFFFAILPSWTCSTYMKAYFIRIRNLSPLLGDTEVDNLSKSKIK